MALPELSARSSFEKIENDADNLLGLFHEWNVAGAIGRVANAARIDRDELHAPRQQRRAATATAAPRDRMLVTAVTVVTSQAPRRLK